MNNCTKLWSTFFFEKTDSRPLAIFRMIFGMYSFFYFIQLFWLLKLYFSRSGFGSYLHLPGPGLNRYLLTVLTNQPTMYFYVVYGATLLVACCFAAGFATRIAATLLWTLTFLWLGPMNLGTNSADNIVKILTFLFMIASVFGHTHQSYSLDRYVFKKKAQARSSDVIPMWSTRLFQIQLVLIYFFSGFHKLSSPDWYQAGALHYVFYQVSWSRIDLSWLTQYPFLTGIITYATLLYELILFPVLIWPKTTRLCILALGVALHVGIAILMKVFVFGEIMPLFYLCFMTMEHYKWLQQKRHYTNISATSRKVAMQGDRVTTMTHRVS